MKIKYAIMQEKDAMVTELFGEIARFDSYEQAEKHIELIMSEALGFSTAKPLEFYIRKIYCNDF